MDLQGAPQPSTRAERWLLAATLASAPLTTSPFLPGHSQVRPLAAIPCALLGVLAIWHFRSSWSRRPRLDLALLALFVLWALGAGGLSAWLCAAPPFRGATASGLYVKAAFTLFVGVGFYVAIRLACRDRSTGRWAVGGLYAGGIASCLLALAQSIHQSLPSSMVSLIWWVTRCLADTPWSDPATWNGRAFGPTLEPSWLASFLTVLLLPVALARMVSGLRAAMGWRSWVGDASVAGLAVISLAAAGSRAGLAAALLIFVVAGLMATPRRARYLAAAAGLLLVVTILAVAMQRAPYIRYTMRACSESWSGQYTASDTLVRLGADERVAGWLSGCSMGLSHPIAGVGMGQAPLAYRTYIPEWSRGLPMVQPNLTDVPGKQLPNPKSMPARIVGELGLVGLALWLAFVASAFLARQDGPGGSLLCFAGLAGLAIDWLSLDSFALPTVWFLLALCVTSRWTGIVDPSGDRPAS